MTTHIEKKRRVSLPVIVTTIAVVSLFVFAAAAVYRQGVLIITSHGMKGIGLALHQYHEEHGSFPPVVVYDKNHVAMHSWRTLIEPQLRRDGDTGTEFPAYDFSKRWDQQVNARTRYDAHPYQFLAVVGPKAAWASDRQRKISDIRDGTSNTMLVVAVRNTGIKWHEPRDIAVVGDRLFIGDRPLDLSADVFVLFADGSPRYFGNGIEQSLLAPMLTIADSDTVPW